MIPAEDLGGLLFGVHHHLGDLVRMYKNNSSQIEDDQILYKEEDIIKLLAKLGFPEPVWGKHINLDDYASNNSTKDDLGG